MRKELNLHDTAYCIQRIARKVLLQSPSGDTPANHISCIPSKIRGFYAKAKTMK